MTSFKTEFGIGQNRVGEENSTCSRGVEPQFLVLLLVLSSHVSWVYTESDTAEADAGIGSYATVNNVSAVENTAALKEDRVEALKAKEMPSIDDDCNQLEISDYVDEMYQYHWVYEAQNQPPENFMLIQADIAPHMRGILVNRVHYKFELMQETLYLMVTLLDQYLSQVTIKKDDMQLVGLTALLLASKYQDFWHPRVKDRISAEIYARAQVLGMLEHLAFYLIELCLVEYEPLRFKPSLLCVVALYVARCTLQITPAWTPPLCKHARYEVSQIRDCAEMVLRFHKAARVESLKVTYEKYSILDLSGVAAIKPLETLPLQFSSDWCR